MMDFTFTDDQRQLRDALRGYLARNNGFSGRTASARSALGWNESLWRGLADDLGILGVLVADAAGGAGGDAVDMMVVMEELGANLLVEPYLETAVIGASALGAAGGREAELKAIASGSMRVAFAWAEAETRFDRMPYDSIASRTATGWRLDGAKAVVIAAPIATHFLVTARAEDGPALFLVKADTAGISLTAFPTIDGRRAADMSFDAVAIPERALVARGAEAIERLCDVATAMLGAEALGVMRVMLDDTIAFTRERRQFGQAIATFQVLQHRMVDMYMQLELATSAVYRAVLSLDAAPAERARAVSAMKVTVAGACRFIGQNAIQLHGGMGMTDEVAVTHYFRRATVIESEFGSADWHRRRFASLSRAA
ncbi:acyl-CoA dehydrogenase family protein [Sphingopyxis macrogoltabida]|nr:acyl-CoA dehydrogenase family protein [Sphingopyxis macrogoltabida]